MLPKILRKPFRAVSRWRKSKSAPVLLVAGLFLASAVLYTMYIQNKRLTVNPATYAPLLQLIASVESNGNYNAYFGNAGNSAINFTAMPIADVMQWQSEYVRQGNLSSAVGKYQIIDSTLRGLVRELNLNTAQLFNQATQDKMAIALLERRGAEAYVNKEITREQFAANLAKEWAALPRVLGANPHESYYAADGLNKAHVSVEQVIGAISPISPR